MRQSKLKKLYARMYRERELAYPGTLSIGFWENHPATQAVCESSDIRGRVLDLGCGTGEIDIWLARKRPDITIDAVDISPEALSYAFKHLSGESRELRSRVKYHEALVEQLPFPDNHFDSCFSSHTLEHIADHGAIFREAYRVLKPGAPLMGIVPLGRSSDDPTHVWHFEEDQFHRHMELFGANVRTWQTQDGSQLVGRMDLWVKPRIVCMMRVRNDERWISRVLQQTAQLVDGFVILDDGSTDMTERICRSCPKVLRYERQDQALADEVGDRNRLLQWILEENPDWILALDGNEVLEDAANITTRREISACPKEIMALEFNVSHKHEVRLIKTAAVNQDCPTRRVDVIVRRYDSKRSASKEWRERMPWEVKHSDGSHETETHPMPQAYGPFRFLGVLRLKSWLRSIRNLFRRHR